MKATRRIAGLNCLAMTPDRLTKPFHTYSEIA